MNQLIIDNNLKYEVIKHFQINETIFEELLELFNQVIKPEISKNYLSHLVSSVEDIINNYKMKEFISNLKENEKKYINVNEFKKLLLSKNIRLFSILLKPLDNSSKKASCRLFKQSAIIFYDPRLEEKQKRTLIAHEIGHIVLNKLKKIDGDIEKLSSLFAFIAMLDKNNFYKNDCKNYTYISDIQLFNDIKNIL